MGNFQENPRRIINNRQSAQVSLGITINELNNPSLDTLLINTYRPKNVYLLLCHSIIIERVLDKRATMNFYIGRKL